MFILHLHSMAKCFVATAVVCAITVAFHSQPAVAQQRLQRAPDRSPRVSKADNRVALKPTTPRTRRSGGSGTGSNFSGGWNAPRVVPQTSLQVKKLLTPKFQWSDLARATEANDLEVHFRWKTGWTGAASARIEVSRFAFPPGPKYKPPYKPDYIQTDNVLNETGEYEFFRIFFRPIVEQALGKTLNPEQPITFYVRLVVLDGNSQILGAPSNFVRVKYQKPPLIPSPPPAMAVWYDTLRCVNKTIDDDGDSDEVTAYFFVADISGPQPVSHDYRIPRTGMDAGETVAVSKQIHAHLDPNSYDPNRLVILVALMEIDSHSLVKPPQLQSLHTQLASWSNLPPVVKRAKLIAGFNACLADLAAQTDHSRIGGVQLLYVPMNVWTELKNNQNVAPQMLFFSGQGGHYQLAFQFKG